MSFLISPLHGQELPVMGLSENGVPELQEGPADCRASHSGIPASQTAQHREHTQQREVSDGVLAAGKDQGREGL